MIRFEGKVALVTGAASADGLGFATARRLARDGAQVMLTDVRADDVAMRAAELASEGHAVSSMTHDVTSEAGWTDVIAALLARFGRLDIVVNNAGVAVLKPMEAMTLADWHRQIEINLTSVYLGCDAALRQMRAQKQGGAIVNISSVAGLVGLRNAGAYAASKGGVRLFSKALALELAPDNIRVNSVHPGVIWTEMQAQAIAGNPEGARLVNAAIPLGRMGAPDDIAAMVAFLASEDANYITGAEFTVDGGFTAQ